jgi:hypothetical protein
VVELGRHLAAEQPPGAARAHLRAHACMHACMRTALSALTHLPMACLHASEPCHNQKSLSCVVKGDPRPHSSLAVTQPLSPKMGISAPQRRLKKSL